MNKPEIPGINPPENGHFPHWFTVIYLIVLFLFAHIAAPWGLSLLSTHFGWVDGRPGPWNWMAFILVLAGIVGTFWMITLHYLASPPAFLEMKPTQKLLRPGTYAFTRNPMYLFELTFWFGWALFYGSITVFVGFLVWFALFNFVFVPYEERDLEVRFGEAYRQYKRMVPRWLGKIRNISN